MRPSVSIIVPCFNEKERIGSLLAAIYAQTYPRDWLEVVIADGMSQDGTREEISAFVAAHPGLSVRIVDNPKRTIPSGLNLAVAAAKGDVIVRLDAHSIPNSIYVEKCVQDLEAGQGSNVGGTWLIRPGGEGWIAAGIAAAASHPLGAGDAGYRLRSQAGPVDTVPFGAFRKSLLERVGRFDETLLTNEDYEFNTRIRRAGGVIWLDPEIQSQYMARGSLKELARQYWRYGYWKLRMLLRYPDSLRWRQAIPPAFVLSIAILAAAAVVWRLAALVLAAELVLYLGTLSAGGIAVAARDGRALIAPAAAAAMLVMHAAWGGGFIWSAVQKALQPNG